MTDIDYNAPTYPTTYVGCRIAVSEAYKQGAQNILDLKTMIAYHACDMQASDFQIVGDYLVRMERTQEAIRFIYDEVRKIGDATDPEVLKAKHVRIATNHAEQMRKWWGMMSSMLRNKFEDPKL